MAMSILYLHKDFSKDAHHGKVFEISNLGPMFICWRPRGSLRISRNHKRGGRAGVPGPWPGPAPWAQALAASFVVPGDPKAAPGSCDVNPTLILR